MEVRQVEDSMLRFGNRYLERVFTPHELDCCRGVQAVMAAGLAGRFAAKEAAMKVLRSSDTALDWRAIEVRRHESGGCELHLSGQARKLAEEARVTNLALSLSHEAGMAGAVVIALCGRA